MTIREIDERPDALMDGLVAVWEASVRATHRFLTGDEVERIKGYVPRALRSVARLVVAEDDEGTPVAFMGVEEGTLEMLFLSPDVRGRGLGRQLLRYGMENLGVERLTVNEQNPQARGFYEHMGFRVVARTETDGQGAPYPLLYMTRV